MMDAIGTSITSATLDEVFEVAFEAAVDCWGMLAEADACKDEDDCFPWENYIENARVTVEKMALLWVEKDGKFDEGRQKLILKLLEDVEWDDQGLENIRDDLDPDNFDEEEDEEDAEGPELKRIRVE